MARPRGTPTRARLGPYFTEGSRLLWGILRDQHGGDVAAMAASCGVQERTLERHLYGDQGLELNVAVTYERLFGVPAALFTDRPTVAFRLPTMVALLALVRETLVASPDGRRTPAMRTVLRDRCAICKVEPDVVLAYAVTDKIAKKVSGVWMLAPSSPTIPWPLSVTRLLANQRTTLEKMLDDHGSIQTHDLANRLGLGYPEAGSMLRELGAAGLVTLKTLVYHRCSEAPIAVITDKTVPAAWTCPECEDDDPDDLSYALAAIPVRARATSTEVGVAS